ncbi:small-conductance mechanosensitive channel [Hoeflea sp. IMCC20628]|uniref:mechanosensitive ion channel domain-containing protein n=1 Tax=Hoeflea sp. IMCC20628 TaxID=1620421 RepID=UPI00063ABE43|nr:mechanosensitive ion channel domain-containing protein [Hoeflea sp. IMCC20628]AKH99726.1 small-conductance mechanosensitive channel [Hoeflea sp. IMCC20628]
MRFDWLKAALLSAVVLIGTGVAAHSQSAVQTEPAGAEPAIAEQVATAPATAVASPIVIAAEEKLAAAEMDIARLGKRVEESTENDTALVDLKLEIETLARSMLDIGVSLRPRMTEIKARLEQLGASPGEGEAPEPDAIVAERNRLNEERALINTLTGRAEAVSVRANDLGNRITEARRDLFSNTLFKRTEISPSMLSESLVAMDGEWTDLVRTYGSWGRFVLAFKWQALLGWAFFSLLAALVFVPGAYRLFGGLIDRDPSDEDPAYTSRLSVAFWSTIIPTIAMTALAGTIYGLLQSFAILRGDVAPVISSMLAIVVAIFFVSKLARGILAPKMPAWRLVNVSNGGARVLYLLVVAMVFVNGFDFVEDQMSQSLGSPVVLTVFKGIISVFMMALILIAMAMVKPMVAKSGDPADPGEPWPRVISVTLLVAGFGLMATASLGYVGLARFAATQIVVTGAILTTMYIGYLSARAISEEGAFAHTIIGRRIETKYQPGHVALDRSGLAAGLLINLLVLLLGVPLILLLWGFQVQDIELWFYRILTEIRIGGITISLVGIFFGVLLFIVGLLATRWFQRWLDGSVMARGSMESGVRNSIKIGVGYLGVALAGLIGISAAGIDLSSLALVAGALSLGIGFGLQNIVSNFVSGLILLAERPFKVGDWVVTGSTEGFVKKISVRATEIETFSRQSIIVPNSELINAPVGNWTHRNKLGRVEVPIGVSYDADPRRVIEILEEVVRSHDLVLNFPAPAVFFMNFGDSSLDFEIKAHIADVLNGMTVRTELRLRIFERLKAEGIEIPFPQRDLNIKLGDQDEPLTVLREKLMERKPKLATPPEPAVTGVTADTETSVKKPAKRRKPTKAGQDSMGDGSGPEGGDR